jgi:hypothetical protein
MTKTKTDEVTYNDEAIDLTEAELAERRRFKASMLSRRPKPEPVSPIGDKPKPPPTNMHDAPAKAYTVGEPPGLAQHLAD